MSTLGVSADGAINTARKNTADGNMSFGASMPDNPFGAPVEQPSKNPARTSSNVAPPPSSVGKQEAQTSPLPRRESEPQSPAQQAPSATRSEQTSSAQPSQRPAPSEEQPAPKSAGSKDAGSSPKARRVIGGGVSRQVMSAEKTRDNKVAYTRVKDVPVALVNIAKQAFPYAKNQTDALVAYAVSVGGSDAAARMREYLTPEQKELVDERRKEPNERLEEKLDHVISLLHELRASEDVVKLLSVFSVFDRFGFRRENPGAPRDANLLESGVSDMFTRAEEQARQYKTRFDSQKGWSKG